MAITRRSFLAGLGSVSVGLFFRRKLDAVLESLERDLVVEPIVPDQPPSVAEIVVYPQAAFYPKRLVVPVRVGKRGTETTFEPCASCDGEGDDDALCDVCEGLGGTYIGDRQAAIATSPAVRDRGHQGGSHGQTAGAVSADLFHV